MNKATELLSSGLKLMEKKQADYGGGSKNFVEAAYIASILRGKHFDAADTAAILLGVKMSRIGNLTESGLPPQNESKADSYVDMANYCGLLFECDCYVEEKRREHDLQKEQTPSGGRERIQR